MRKRETIQIHAAAPDKPLPGAPCNGCGVCCQVELCPLGILRYFRRAGPCPALHWVADVKHYRCGLLEKSRNPLVRWWVKRFIAAGNGCDSTALLDPGSEVVSD